jgi:hypothetical protein
VIYKLTFQDRIGLWELEVDHFRARFYRTRDAAMKCVTRYRRAIQTIYDREEEIRWNQLSPGERIREFDQYDQ